MMQVKRGVFSFSWRSLAVFGFDLMAVVIAWMLAVLLTSNFSFFGLFLESTWIYWYMLPIQAVIFRVMGLYRGIWHFSSLPDLLRISRAVLLSVILLTCAFLYLPHQGMITRANLLLYPTFLLVMMAGGRITYRIWKEHSLYGESVSQGQSVIVIGAGRIGARLVHELSRSVEWCVVGFLDDDPAKIGREIMGIKVYGPVAELDRWAGTLGVEKVILAVPSGSDSVRKRLTRICVDADVRAYTVPTTEELLSGQNRLAEIRPIDLDDLLGRIPVRIDTPEIRGMLTGKVVMVTGAGGSIGSELCRQIAELGPAQIVFFDNSEFALYKLHDELSGRFPAIQMIPFVGDVKDSAWVTEVMRRYPPAVLFHAAAYKHVPLMEEHNAWQALRNNILGTYVVGLAASQSGVPEFVLVSTDKAVNPINVMGASKRLAEMVCQSLQNVQITTRFEIVRFGNVLGSTGSVIPKFQAQIKAGGPITVTHPEITRYFMSIPEAAQLVLQAAAMGDGGEIFVLDMGQPVRIADIAKQMIRLSGHHEKDIQVVFTGLRPGEKLYEELLSDEEETCPTYHPKLRIAKARPVPDGWLEAMLAWLKAAHYKSDSEVRQDLRKWLPEYQPSEVHHFPSVHQDVHVK